MKALKTAIRRLAQSAGFDIVRARNGQAGANPFRRLVRSCGIPVVFDVGANAGQSVDTFLKAFPAATIHSFEPGPAVFAKLKQHCARLPGVTAWNYGVGSRDGLLAFHENEYSDMSSFLAPRVGGATGRWSWAAWSGPGPAWGWPSWLVTSPTCRGSCRG
jgi:hypothetical protein